ncbi:hypothetical protein [Roseateles asaccharophilus]|uniref:hypothetical protein n=1 Tax=Roseateles asaccharophilus TaxID=582607 RepID=UPI00384B60D7
MNRLTSILLLASLPIAAAAADTVGTRLDRMLNLKAEAEMARQESALREEMLRAGAMGLPTIVSITGSAANLTARLQVNSTSQRVYAVGDHIGNGYNIVFIKPDEVLVARPAATKGGSMKLVPLSFSQPEVTGAAGGARPAAAMPAGPLSMPMSVVPPLPTSFPAPASPAK